MTEYYRLLILSPDPDEIEQLAREIGLEGREQGTHSIALTSSNNHFCWGTAPIAACICTLRNSYSTVPRMTVSQWRALTDSQRRWYLTGEDSPDELLNR